MMKPSIGMFVVITVIPSLIMAEHTLPAPLLAMATLVGTFLATSSAGMFNHLIDIRYDSIMERTKGRPLPLGSVSPQAAVVVASLLGIASFVVLFTLSSPLAAWIAVGANAFYVLAYTMYLKPRTVQNIVIGGAAGAVGPLIGWAAVTETIGWPAWVLFLVIFFWTPPHFWALAIKYKDDYKKAGIPMLPSVKGVKVTKNNILGYTLLLLPVVASLWYFGAAGNFYLVVSGLLTLRFCQLAYRLWRSRDESLAMGVFYFSLLFILGVFVSLTIDRVMSLY
jgi:heme o synthase